MARPRPNVPTLIVLALSVLGSRADFDSTLVVETNEVLGGTLDVALMHAVLMQKAIQNRAWLFNRSLDMDGLGDLMYGQMHSLDEAYYHIYTGFNDGSFLGYYHRGVLDGDHSRFGLSVQSAANTSSCPEWNITSVCRRRYSADWATGVADVPLSGQAGYDCRTRAWWYDVQASHRKMWSARYVDTSVLQAAFAACVPIMNLTTMVQNPENVDEHGFLGVACAGMLLEELSADLEHLFPDSSQELAYIRDRENGQLVAASVPDSYFDTDNLVAYDAYSSPDPLLRWSAEQIRDIGGGTWPTPDNTTLHVKNETDSSVESYYLSKTSFGEGQFPNMPLPWDLVVVQKVPCDPGYEVDTSTMSCKACSLVQANSDSVGGGGRCTSCVRGYYRNHLTDQCEPCPSHAVCEGGTHLPYPKKGYWQDTSDIELLYHEPLVCPHPDACPGGERVSHCFMSADSILSCDEDSICATAASGKLCSKCASGYFPDGQSCRKCSEAGSKGGTILFIIIMMFVLLGLVVVWVLYHETLKQWYPATYDALFNVGRFKVIWATIQIIGSIAWNVGLEWPEPFRTLSEAFNLSQLSLFDDLVPTKCVLTNYNFYDHVLSSTLVPIGIAAFLVLSYLFTNNNLFLKRLCDARLRLDSNDVLNYSLLLSFIVLPSTSLTLFRTFVCTEFSDGSYYLSADLSLTCDISDPGRAGMVAYAIIMVLVYPVGIPAAYWWLLSRPSTLAKIKNRKPGEAFSRRVQALSFLFESYTPEHPRAEVLYCIQRVTLCGLVVFMGNTPAARASAAFAIATFFAVGFREYMPFSEASTNALAITAQWQVVCTLIMALVLLLKPFGYNESVLGTVMFIFNLGIFALSLKTAKEQAAAEAARLQELAELRAKIEAFSENLLSVFTIQENMTRERRRELIRLQHNLDDSNGLGVQISTKPPPQITSGRRKSDILTMGDIELGNLANVLCQDGVISKLDVDVMQHDKEELRNFLQVKLEEEKRGFEALWYWFEDESRLSMHDPRMVYKDPAGYGWVRYADSISAQLERSFKEYMRDPHANGGSGRMVSIDVDGRVVSAAHTGGKSKQFASDTGTKYTIDLERMVQLNVVTGYERKVLRQEVANKRAAIITRLASDSDVLDSLDFLEDNEIQPLPQDLIDAREPVLLVKKGQLVQIQKRRDDDGWVYGYVVCDPNEDDMDDPAARQQDDNDDLGGTTAGWIPRSFTRNPTAKELKVMRDALGGGDDAASFLDPPDYWNKDDDDVGAKLYPIQKDSDEWRTVMKQFRSTLDQGCGVYPNGSMGRGYPGLKLGTLHRIQNMGLWQSYATKKRTMLLRAEREGADASGYERTWMYHGAPGRVIKNIYEQGFNRSFAGANAVLFGKGTYFARDASYSAHPTYSQPDSDGYQYMFMTRVLVGEYCLGVREAPTPKVRIPGTLQLYDSTCGINERDPILWVTYHDAQAYPEYLVKFKSGNPA